MTREGNLAKNTFVLGIGTFLPRLASFITLPVLTAYLTQEEYGTYDLITILVSLVLPAVTLQIQTAAFRFLIDKRRDEKESAEIVTNIFAFIIPASIVGLLVLSFFLFSFNFVEKFLICFYFFVDILQNALGQTARGLNHNLSYSISAIVNSVVKMILCVACVWYLRMGLIGAVVSLSAADIISFVFLSWKINIIKYIKISLMSWETIKELLNYSWPMVPNSMSMWVIRVSDRFVVTLFMGVSANAIYSVANKIPQLLTIAQSTFTMAWQENASMYSKDDDASAYYSSMFRTMYDLMAGFLGLLIAATPILFKILIRGKYEEAYYQIPILFLAMFFYSMSAFLGGIYVAYKATRSIGITTMVAATCNLIIDIVAIKYIGLYAASGSTLVSYIFLFVFRLFDVRKLIYLKYDYKRIVLVLMIMVAECVMCFQQILVFDLVNLVFGTIVFMVLNRAFVRAVINKGMKIFKGVNVG